MGETSFFQDLLATIAERGRRLLDFAGDGPANDAELVRLCEALLSSLGEASGVALAQRILHEYERRDEDGRATFFERLADHFGIDADAAVAAAQAYRDEPGVSSLERLLATAEPRRQELLRRLNQAPSGTAKLVRMREDLLRLLPAMPQLGEVDMDFRRLFQSWFNRGFLVLRRVDWQTPAAILEKIIRYEAVHEISDWDDLRRRIDPPDRRCFAFFHPALTDEPLIFVEVALTDGLPGSVQALLSEERQPIPAERAQTAVFYSISNCQLGLRGVSFGNFLIKQVVEDLSSELRRLETFVTLSPVPGFRRWLESHTDEEVAEWEPAFTPDLREIAEADDWTTDPAAANALQRPLLRLAAAYLVDVRDKEGRPADPVARFHLGNGARLERINWMANLSPRGLRESHGIMVNYLYDPAAIESNHEAFVKEGTIAAPRAVRALVPTRRARAGAPIGRPAAEQDEVGVS
ncbi:MAG TPA: malonyl-CoA decarboxylase [Afifellaceae bacterium]|nr:malonyl-CoA decarboxylase [Afifellaceae bacterium]